jgi:hypothetical protein
LQVNANESVKRGGQLLFLVLGYYLIAWFYVVALWFERLKFLRDLQIVVAAGFLALWLLFAYRHRLGLMKGLIVGTPPS